MGGDEAIAFHRVAAASPFTPDYLNVIDGLSLSAWARWSLNGSGSPTAHYEFSLGAISDSRDISEERSTLSTVLRLVNPALYVNSNGVWEWRLGSVEWEIDGLVTRSYPGGVYASEIAVSPLSIPLFTGVLTCSASGTIETGAISGTIAPGDDAHSSLAASATVGYRVKIAGTYYVFPAQLLPVSMPSPVSGVVSTSVDSLASVTDSYHVVLVSEAEMTDTVTDIGAVASNGWDVWRRVQTVKQRDATVTLIADPGFGVERLNRDYAELIYRGAMPGASAHGRYVYFFGKPHPGEDPDEYSTSAERDTPVYAASSEFLDVIQDGASPLEDVFRTNWSWPTLTASAGQTSAYYIVLPGAASVPSGYTNPPGIGVADPAPHPYGVATAAFTFPVIQPPSGTVVSNLNHQVPEAVLLNTVYNPLWSMRLFFPPDGLAPTSGNAWTADGVAEGPTAYWLPRREQMAKNSHLPPEKSTADRLQIVAECLSTNGLAGLMSELSGGVVTSFWGLSRFGIVPVMTALPESLICSSPTLWSVAPVDAGTLEFGSKVTLHPTAGDCQIRVNLFDPAGSIGFYNAVASAVTLGWELLPVGVTLRAFWITYDGVRAEIDLSPGSGHLYAKPQSLPKRYIDTVGEDWSIDDIPDLGRDLKATGVTVAAYEDPIFGLVNQAFQPFGTNRQYLALEFRLSGLGSDSVTLHFPRLERADGGHSLLYDRSQRGVVLQAESGPIRWGCFCYYDPILGLILDWPQEQAHELAPSALDAFGFAHNLAGRSCTDSLAAEVSAQFDAGIEYTQLKHLAGDPFTQAQVTHAFMLLGSDGRMVLAAVNSYREVPPLAAFPSAIRDPNTWTPSPGLGFSGKVFSWGQIRRYCAEPLVGEAPAKSVIQNADGVEVPSQEEDGVAGWRVWSYRLNAPTDSESGYRCLYRSVPYLEFRPWRGLLWTLGIPPTPGLAAGYDVSGSLRHVRAYAPTGEANFWLGHSDNRLTWADRDSGLPATWARPRFAKLARESIGVLFGDGERLNWARTNDLGATWADGRDLGEGTLGDFEEGAAGLKWIYKLMSSDGGTTYDVWGQLRDNRMEVIRDWRLTSLTGVDETALAVRESIGSDGAWRIGVLYFISGAPITKFSRDGLSFF